MALPRNQDDAVLKAIHEKVESKIGIHWETRGYRWTDFLNRMALELHHETCDDHAESNVQDVVVDEVVVDALVAVIVYGIETASAFESTSGDKAKFRNQFQQDYDIRDIVNINNVICDHLFNLRPKLLKDDLLSVMQGLLTLNGSRRESMELEAKKLPESLDADQQHKLGLHMKLVNREKSINMLLKHAAEQFNEYLNRDALGGFQWVACSGGPGLGKTTFCREAFTKAVGVGLDDKMWTDVPEPEQFYNVLKACVNSGRQYRLAFSNPTLSPQDEEDPSMSLAWRLTQAITKQTFPFPERRDGLKQLERVLHSITKGRKESLVVINFDDMNKLLDDPKGRASMNPKGRNYMNTILATIQVFNRRQKGYVFCIFSGTNVRPLHDLLKDTSDKSSINPVHIPLPLLGSDHVFEVFNDLLDRTLPETEMFAAISTKNKTQLEFILKVLGGVPRYIEMLVYALCVLKTRGRGFSWSSFREALTSDEGSDNICSNAYYLTESVRDQIAIRYPSELSTILDAIPWKHLVGYSLFEWHVTHDTRIGETYRVEDLERIGLVLLQSFEEEEDAAFMEFKLVFPLVLLLKMEAREGKSSPKMLLQNFSNGEEDDKNERNNLQAIFALKAETLQEIDGTVPVRQLLPSLDERYKYSCVTFSSFDNVQAPSKTEKRPTWDTWLAQYKENGWIIRNASNKGATFSEMIMIAENELLLTFTRDRTHQNAIASLLALLRLYNGQPLERSSLPSKRKWENDVMAD